MASGKECSPMGKTYKQKWEFSAKDKLGRVQDKISGKFDKLRKKTKRFEGRFKKTFSGSGEILERFGGRAGQIFGDLKSKFSGLAGMGPSVINPITLITAAILGLGVAVGSLGVAGVQKARAFNHEFLQLKNLNLDKTTTQIDGLKQSVLDTSVATGLAAGQVSDAFFDVQSVTGKFGNEVSDTVKKVGDFSVATGTMDLFNKQVGAAATAMKIFGLESAQMDQYLASSFKTVQVGKVTFAQLAQVQTEYLGSARSANQELDTANKLFAVLSVNAKSADIAATQTKTAFEGLTSQPFIDALQGNAKKKISGLGIKVFDNGEMRQVDDILKDLIPKIQEMSGERFVKFRNSIGGPEGLKELLNQSRASGTKLLETLNTFDETNFSLADAAANANKDFDTQLALLMNIKDTVLVQIGEQILPTITVWLAKVVDKSKEWYFGLKNAWNQSALFRDSLAAIWKFAGFAVKVFMPFIPLLQGAWKSAVLVNNELKSWGIDLGAAVDWIDSFYTKMKTALDKLNTGFVFFSNLVRDTMQAIVEFRFNDIPTADRLKALHAKVAEKTDKVKPAGKAKAPASGAAIPDGGKEEPASGGSGSQGSSVSDFTSRMSGAAHSKQININNNIARMQAAERIIVNNKDGNLDLSELERKIEEVLINVLNNSQAAVPNG